MSDDNEEIENPGPAYRISIDKDPDYEFSDEVSTALEALATAIAEEETEVAGFAFGNDLAIADPAGANLLGGIKLGPIVICGCDDGANCRCNGGSFSKAFETIEF